MRSDRRKTDQLRHVEFQPDFQSHPIASVLSVSGGTRVLCSVSVENSVPGWMKNRGVEGGWITAEYQMLPGASAERISREVSKGHVSGRSAEIQRLIGRSLRAVVDLEKLPGITLHVDCDVIDADGGTRCASISGASVALELAALKLWEQGVLQVWPLKERVAAVSVGIVDGTPMLDLCYVEDSAAEVDMNVIMTASGRFVEIQGTGEEATFDDKQLSRMLQLAKKGLKQINDAQEKMLKKHPLGKIYKKIMTGERAAIKA